MATRTTLYIPTGLELHRWMQPMTEWAAMRHLEVLGVVRDWTELSALLGAGEYDIGVIPSWDHLRPDRLPRLVAMEDHPPPAPTQRQRPRVSWPESHWI